MRFTVEERHLTDTSGRPLAAPGSVEFHTCDADTLDEAVRLFIRKDSAQIIGEVLKFPGMQAVATIRKTSGVYTVQFAPASQHTPR